MKTFQALLMYPCLVGAFALTAWCIALVWRRQIALFATQLFEKWSRLGNFGRVLLVTFVSAMIVYGSTKTNLTDGVMGGTTNAPMMMGSVPAPGVGHARYGVVQPAAGRVPTGATLAQNLWRRGCWEDWLSVSFEDGWVFPHGTNHLSRVAVMTQGELRSKVRDTDAVASLGVKVAHVPFDTCFYHEHTPSNSYRFTWDRAYVDRSTNMPMFATVELFRNGDISILTNGVSTFTPREIPYPHVGIGQNDEWVRTNFVNAAEILAVGYANWVNEQVGVNLENGLFKFTATFPDDPPEATLLTVGDLSVVVTNAGEYVFLLEKGVEYTFGTAPYDETVEYSMQDDAGPDAEIVYPAFSIFHSQFSILSWWCGDTPGEWTVDGDDQYISEPTLIYLGCCYWEPKFRGSPDVTNLLAADFPMTFTAVFDNAHTNGVAYHWTTDNEKIYIETPYAQTTQVSLDSAFDVDTFSLTVEAFVTNRTYQSTLQAAVSTNDHSGLSLSMPDTLFADNDDDNNDGILDLANLRFSPDDVLNRNDDVVGATIGLPSGAARNGTLRLFDNEGFVGWIYDSVDKNDYVGLGTEWEMTDLSLSQLPLEVCGTVKSEGYKSSVLNFRWTSENGEERMLLHRFTVIDPVVEPICSERKTVVRDGVEHKIVYNPCGVVIGKDAYFKISVEPDNFPDSKIHWRSVGNGTVAFVGGNTGREVCVRGVTEGIATLEIDIGGCSAARPTFPIEVVENVSVMMDVCILCNNNVPIKSESAIRSMLLYVNDIFEQVGMTFYINSVITTNIPHAVDVMFDGSATDDNLSFDNVADILPNAGGLKCYFVNSFEDSRDTVAANSTNGMLLTASADAQTWAHEIGHACGLRDIYASRSGNTVPLDESFEWRHAMDDWNNGSIGEETRGSRYYRRNLPHVEVITNLLMYGYQSATALDISTGYVDGVVKIDKTTSAVGGVRTGLFASDATRSPIHRRKEERVE